MTSGLPRIDSRVVDRALRTAVWAAIGHQGFERRVGRTAWRDRLSCVEVMNVQSFDRYLADQMACTPYSFSVNLGVYWPAIAALASTHRIVTDPARPREQHCQARNHLAKGIAQPDPDPSLPPPPILDPRLGPRRWRDRPDVWFVASDGSNLEEVVADATAQVLRVGLPWLERMSDPDEALRAFEGRRGTTHAPGIVAEDYGGALGSPARRRAAEALKGLPPKSDASTR